MKVLVNNLELIAWGRGAPGNGGGGGNDSNTGGGGGSNFGTGGQGGQRLNAGAGDCGGSYPGRAVNRLHTAMPITRSIWEAVVAAATKRNDGSRGADGGGIVIIRADEIV